MTQNTNPNNDSGSKKRARTDGGIRATDAESTPVTASASWSDLNSFRRDCLVAIAALEDTPKGLTIKTWLETEYDEHINHGRLYPALDDLVAYDLVEKGQRDGRTNEYELTERGEQLLDGRCAQLAEVLQ